MTPHHDDWFVRLLGGDSNTGTVRFVLMIFVFVAFLATTLWIRNTYL